MLDEKVAKLLNTQINKEFYSAYLYLSFSNYFTQQGLDGFANWYSVQAQEERDHALLFMKYMQNNDAVVTLEAVEQPIGKPPRKYPAYIRAQRPPPTGCVRPRRYALHMRTADAPPPPRASVHDSSC